ncbi:MAG TPA: hypothetical protein VN603_06195 [Candidatus Acidoferrales bacterium]|jgi:hypothetical protein|nr:hypothetical protein [Candidatus Acidoferrales bacterium]
MIAVTPVDLFGSVDTPMGATRLWVTWIGMAVFVALLFSVLVDWMHHQHKFGNRTYAFAAILVVALVLLIFLPRG